MQEYLRYEKRTLTPQKVVKILAEHGTIITLEQGEIVLEFLYKLSNLSVSQAIKAQFSARKRVWPK